MLTSFFSGRTGTAEEKCAGGGVKRNLDALGESFLLYYVILPHNLGLVGNFIHLWWDGW